MRVSEQAIYLSDIGPTCPAVAPVVAWPTKHNRTVHLEWKLPACSRKGHQGVLSPPTLPETTKKLPTLLQINREFSGARKQTWILEACLVCLLTKSAGRTQPKLGSLCASSLFRFPSFGPTALPSSLYLQLDLFSWSQLLDCSSIPHWKTFSKLQWQH